MAETALVTGSSSGIGLACARLLLQQGYRVIGISRRGQVAEFADKNFTALALDLADSERVEAEIKTLLQQESIDCFVHAAGMGLFGSIEQNSRAQIENLLRVNLTSAILLSRGLLPAMRRRGSGRLIFIGSEAAHQAGRKGALYCASKFGLRGFCLALRDDCAGDGIQVSLINPGMVRSPFFDNQDFAPGELPENAIETDDVASAVWQVLQSSADIVYDEIRLSPRVKSIDFGKSS